MLITSGVVVIFKSPNVYLLLQCNDCLVIQCKVCMQQGIWIKRKTNRILQGAQGSFVFIQNRFCILHLLTHFKLYGKPMSSACK